MSRRISRGNSPQPPISRNGFQKLSEFRRAEIHNIENQKQDKIENGNATASVVHSSHYRDVMVKKASSSQTVLPTTKGISDMLGPEVYSPLFILANLNLPKDRVTMNAWNRVFYDTHPVVRNAINLHASYPISKINISHPDKKVQEFFLEMAEKIDLYSVVYGAALEFWKLGECFPYAELDRETNSWKKITILNPDYIHVKKSAIGDHTIISLRPDAGLQRLVNSNSQSDIALKKRLPKHIVDAVKKGESIPLDGINISHLKLLSSPYDVRGTSVIVSVYKDLMHYDKLRECFDKDTEVLTSNGFKKYTDIFNLDNQSIKNDVMIASYNDISDKIEYLKPTNSVLKDFTGEMIHFNGKKIDCMVTPNHRVYSSKKTSEGWQPYEISLAKDIGNGSFYKFKTSATFDNLNDIDEVIVGDKKVPVKTYLKFAGYLVSEGCIYQKIRNDKRKNGYQYFDNKIITSQLPTSLCFEDMKNVYTEISDIMGYKLSESFRVQDSGFSKSSPKEIWSASIFGKELVDHCIENFGIDGKTDSFNKRIPRWVLNLKPELQRIMLSALVSGDGSIFRKKTTTSFRYNTVSKQLADDVFEMVYKCGFTPTLGTYKRAGRDINEYVISWSYSGIGVEPLIYNNFKYNAAKINKVNYNDKVWCVEVPTGLIVTRRNGKIVIQGQCKFAQADNMVNPLTLVKLGGSNDYRPTQSDLDAMKSVLEEAQYDKDFKIVTHDGVTIERVGYGGQILDISQDLEFIMNNLYIGLMVPKSIIEQDSVTYASSSIGLEVLRQRYDIFRNMMKKWLEQKIFAPISQLQGFFNYKDGQKILQVPTVDFNHMNLYDMSDYIQGVSNFVANEQVSLQTLYRSLGLSYEEEKRRLREEAIDKVKKTKELEALNVMRLRELENLDPNGVIPEPPASADGMGGLGPDMDSSGLPGLELPGMPSGGPGEGLEGMGGPDISMPPPSSSPSGGGEPKPPV